MRAMYTYTCANFINYNKLLLSICREMGCFYLDWFAMYLNTDRSDFNKVLYSDNIHLNRTGYNLIQRCLKTAVDCDRYLNFEYINASNY